MKFEVFRWFLACGLLAQACGDDSVALPDSHQPSDAMGDEACAKLKEGASCGDSAHCASGHCVDDRCGDGVRNGPLETCDDGNQVQGDGCDPSCCLEGPGCGDGKLGSDEECDDGNWFDDDGCSNGCTTNQCGNMRVDVGEECDDGNHVDTDSCSNKCLVVACRNGRLEPGEECDDGNSTDHDACTNACKTSICGNGKVEKYESCDDGNIMDGDDCPKNCVTAVCGNGTLDFGEVCEAPEIVVTNGQGDRQGCSDDCSMVVDEDPCEQCQDTKCSDYQGVNLVDGCFHTINTAFGADPQQDPSFIQHCIDVVNCALEHSCGFDDTQRGAVCYCGSRTVDECSTKGPADDAPCTGQWLAAALTASNQEMQVRFSDLAYASGWAYALLDCYGNSEFCADTCRPKPMEKDP